MGFVLEEALYFQTTYWLGCMYTTAKIITDIAKNVNEEPISFCQKIIDFFKAGVKHLNKAQVQLITSGGGRGLGGQVGHGQSIPSDDGGRSPGF